MVVKRFTRTLQDREYTEYLVGKVMMWFGYFVCLGLLVLLWLSA
ncbi:MAG TPA: hypothetical protein VNK49_08855 [Anaerolineales bacterium]|nr:hypothetical protein [Anaerolineales bacterium]